MSKLGKTWPDLISEELESINGFPKILKWILTGCIYLSVMFAPLIPFLWVIKLIKEIIK